MKEKYAGIDYESCENCFEKYGDVTSSLLYGDLSAIPEPWLTVFIPTYKRYDLFEQALESVLTQWHADFLWDVVVLDNEPYDGKPNRTEKLIRRLKNKRVLYYRNSENIPPADNFNRGIQLARGKWVTMLHNDDLLVANTLQNLGKLIEAYDTPQKPLGAIAAQYIQFEYDAEQDLAKADLAEMNARLCKEPTDYKLYPLTHDNVKIYGHIGGSVPSNGTTFRKEAVLAAGGFNTDYGISGDLILFYNIENRYAAYQTEAPLGFYRWGSNTMINIDSTRRTIRDGYDFREYVYARHPIVGLLFRKCHYKKFTSDVVQERNNVCPLKADISDFDDIYAQRPNGVWYFIYLHLICKFYSLIQKLRMKAAEKKALRKIKK